MDIFQSIKSARIHHAGLVQSVVRACSNSISWNYSQLMKLAVYLFLQEQYILCHNVLADFVDSFETYANFKDVI